MRQKFCCDANQEMYEDYYLRQSGSGLPVFQGSRGQRGHGLGSMLSGLFRSAIPMLKRGLATFGKHALKTRLEIAGDVADGSSFKDSAKARFLPTIVPGIKRFAEQEIFSKQSGSGKRRKTRRKVSQRRRRNIVRRRSRKTKKDIFD
jgi:hypothetical protein